MLAVLGVAGGFPPAAQAGSSPGPTWTRLATATHPPGEAGTMAYDAANGTLVVFAYAGARSKFGDTWTWKGSAWTGQAPAAHPAARFEALMAYDAASRTAVLFGGATLGPPGPATFHDTWAWG